VQGDYQSLARKVPVGVLITLLVGGVTSAAAQTPASVSTRGPFHLLEATIDDIHMALKSGQITCRGLVDWYLKRIAAYERTGPTLNAIQTVNPLALQEAERLDTSFRPTEPLRPLHCVPVLVKDQVEAKDMPTTYGSAVFKDFVSHRDATIVTKMKNAGAVILAKTTMGEFASGYLGSGAGIIRNAYDPKRNASGSSAGTGSGVTANFASVGIGEDTGGSIRGPAAVNSLVGLRPTLGLVSRHGMMPATPTTDALGPITRTVKDAAILLDVLAGYDPADLVTVYAVGKVPDSYTSLLSEDGLRGARIGVIREPMDANADPKSDDYRKVRTVIDKAIAELKRLGAELIDPITVPERKDRLRSNPFEAEEAINAYLAALPNAPVKTLRDIILSGKVLPRRARALMNNMGRSTNEAGYLPVLLGREEMRRLVLKLMADHRLDAFVYATFDHQPAEIPPDILTNPDARDAYARGSNRSLSPAVGFPAITVPAGFTTDGLPVGLEFMGAPFAEGKLFRLTYAYEAATRNRKPPASTPPLPGEP
jgi:amidase